MLAHVEEVQHVHPHGAGVAWEFVVFGVLVTLVVVVVVATSRRMSGSPSVPGADGGGEREVLGDE